MASEFVLDPVSGIPDPPSDESMLLEWAGELTKSLQRDHVANVDRTETMIMTDRGTNKRPPSTGSRRLFHDSKSGTIYIDTEITPTYSEWVPINESSKYVSDGLGVYVQLSTTLPWTTSSSGYISWDEEVWDAADYWAIGSPTEIDMPEKNHYQVVVEGKFDNLEEDGVFLIGAEIEGVTSPNPEHFHQITSTGTAVEYDVKVSFIIEMNEDDTLKFGYVAEDSVGDPSSADFSELSCVVTPVTLSTGGGAPNVQAHSELSGLTADDHLHYLLASSATNRATFAANWTDLTDGGETSLHTHASGGSIYIDNGGKIYWRNGADSAWLEMLTVNGSNQFIIGDSGYDLTMDFNVGLLNGADDLTIGAGTSSGHLLSLTGGEVLIQSYAAKTTITSFLEIDMNGTRIDIPYLGSAPSTLVNGSIWMESDGLHIYYGGSEYYIAGAAPP